MKTASVLAAAAGLGLASAVMAQPQVLNVGAITNLVPGQPQVFNFNVGPNFNATQFSFMGDLAAIGPAGAWGADMRLVITSPNGTSVPIGGYDSWMVGELDWDFTGSGSANPGAYMSGPHTPPGPQFGNSAGQWTLTFTNDWSFGGFHDWNNVKVTLLPAPGAAALLGMGGLMVFRRRR